MRGVCWLNLLNGGLSSRRNRHGRLVQAALLAWIAAIGSSCAVAEEEKSLPADAPRQVLAILVGITNYNRLPQLRWCNNDVSLVEKTLQRYCACDQIIVMTNESEEEKYKPTRGNIIAVFKTRLNFADKMKFDRIFIYFAGHGLRDGTGKLFFAPQDFSYSAIDKTGLSIAEVREILDESKHIGEKILILDTCHAGSNRGGSSTGVSGKAFADELLKSQRLFTLAACSGDEESQEPDSLRHGLFTYWLCEGLAGQADQKSKGNGDRRIDTNELTDYVAENVGRESLDSGKPQHPLGIYSKSEKAWKADLAFLPPEAATPQKTAVVDAFFSEAEKYRKGGNYAGAIDRINRALALEPGHAEAFALRGCVHLDRGKSRGATVDPDLAFVDYQAAIDDFDRAIAARQGVATTTLASWFSKRCDARYLLGENEQALEDACKVIELQPTSAQAYSNRGKIYRQLKKIKEAEQDEQEARRQREKGDVTEVFDSSVLERCS